jgi:hypothetical protein
VLCASSMLPWASLRALPASEYPSGLDHQLHQPQVFAACSADGMEGGCGGNGGSSALGAVGSASLLVVSETFGACDSSVSPSEETLTFVMDVGSAFPLLDLRLVRNLVGASSFGFFASSPGSSPVAPPLTPMLSLAVLTIAGALERQLPDPLSHLFFGVWVPVVVGVDAPSEAVVEVDEARELLDSALGGASPSLGTVDAVVLSAMPASGGGTSGPVPVPPAGAWGFGFDFLRGLIRARKERSGTGERASILCRSARSVCKIRSVPPGPSWTGWLLVGHQP